jgi:urease accessory protein
VDASELPTGWHASLALRFARRGDATRLVHNRHEGPLRLIRALSQDDGRCQAVIVHPPGGLVGGDLLELDVVLDEGARVVCTTPGAQKWYRARASGGAASARTRVGLGAGAALEWLPQPAIVYDEARVDQSIAFELAADARMIGWECLVLGRAAMGERFARGTLRQSVSLSVGGAARWVERAAADAGDRLFVSPLGWGGRTVACSVWAVAPGEAIGEALRDAWREAIDAACASDEGRAARLDGGATVPTPGLLAARLLADDSQAAMRVAQALWARARPELLGAASAPPRIWAT